MSESRLRWLICDTSLNSKFKQKKSLTKKSRIKKSRTKKKSNKNSRTNKEDNVTNGVGPRSLNPCSKAKSIHLSSFVSHVLGTWNEKLHFIPFLYGSAVYSVRNILGLLKSV